MNRRFITLTAFTLILVALASCGDNGSVAFAPTVQRLPVSSEVPVAAPWRNEILVPNTVDSPASVAFTNGGLDVCFGVPVPPSATSALPATGTITFSIVGNADQWTVIAYPTPIPPGAPIAVYPAELNLVTVHSSMASEVFSLRRSATSVPLTIRCTVAGEYEDYPVVIIPNGG